MRTRRIISLARVAALVVVIAATALHASINQYRSRPLDRQNIGYIQAHRQTTNTDWAQIGGWSFSDGMSIAAARGHQRDAERHRLRGAGRVPDRDGSAREGLGAARDEADVGALRPTGRDGLVLVHVRGGRRPRRYTINLLWRSPTGVQTNLDGGSLVVQYAAR